mmetsp:Transcript_10636/g.26178  ORF Transcript_10636/g.26178 Transcript_10636/m.26178 type:complete len:419 (-) Transcript_10636:254-1510(-)|eukprot:CAMPEP_0181118872 /NCGR_PEP_ID=MMETSP1071-20121207/23308_1 /TAXON_ID=35127 /ORGANISM="Thalassiosira sp., Strain NH16" /LENGTH=418 /DNA_ID=CAMNT_0023203397 /DNA_START=57 /DNA_END=1313 /DNA_ORIENTATION=+
MESNAPSNPFSGEGNIGHNSDEEGAKFDAFSLSPVADARSSPAAMPSLQSIQQQEQQIIMQQQQQQQQMPNRQLEFDSSLPSPRELELKGPMNSGDAPSAAGGGGSWPPTPPANNYNTASNANTGASNRSNQSFLSKLVSCGGLCSVEALRPYFDVDTADVIVRVKGSLRYCMVNDGFRNEVMYSDNALRLAYRDTASGSNVANESGGEGGSSASAQQTPDTTSPGKGPDLYGPVWITLTLVFFVAVTSNMSLYIHHRHNKKSIVDEGGIAAEEEWDYDINQLLHATWILYSFSMGLPTLVYFVLSLVGVNRAGGLAELVCLYGYSLVPYLPVAWLCILPYGWLQWTFLGAATVLSGMLVLRNVVGSILESTSLSIGGGGQGGSGLQGKGGGLIMCLVGCHFVFFLVMKLAFYHHSRA